MWTCGHTDRETKSVSRFLCPDPRGEDRVARWRRGKLRTEDAAEDVAEDGGEVMAESVGTDAVGDLGWLFLCLLF